jgi:hypothetical protein
VTGLMTHRALIDAMRWKGNKETIFHVINRATGKETKIGYKADPFFFLVSLFQGLLKAFFTIMLLTNNFSLKCCGVRLFIN